MRLSRHAIESLAQMVCGAHGNEFHPLAFKWSNFPYRSGPKLTSFFYEDCRLPYKHDGSTRISWVTSILKEINEGKTNDPEMPADDLRRVIQELLDSVRSEKPDCHQEAIDDLNQVLHVRDGLQVRFVNGQHILTKASVQDTPSEANFTLQGDEHPNIPVLLRRMEDSLNRGDYAAVLHASASVFETLAKDVVGIPTIENQTLKGFFERYRKDSRLPDKVLDYVLSIYESRNTTPLAGHGSTRFPSVSREEAIVLFEMTRAFVRIEYGIGRAK